MNLEDAKKVAAIVGTADAGCSTCIGNLIDRLNKSFPHLEFCYTDEPLPDEQPEWSEDPEDASSPGLVVEVEERVIV